MAKYPIVTTKNLYKDTKKYYRKEKLKRIIFKGEKVYLPFNEEGIILDYNCVGFDFYPFKVKITKAYVMNEVGDILEFSKEQIKLKKEKLNKWK